MSERKSTLKRDVQRARIKGVCAGFAKYFGIELWVVRLITFGAFIFAPPFMLFLYIGLTLILEKEQIEKPYQRFEQNTYRNNDDYHVNVKTTAWQAGLPPKQALASITESFDKLDSRIQNLEKYATSERFRVEREFRQL